MADDPGTSSASVQAPGTPGMLTAGKPGRGLRDRGADRGRRDGGCLPRPRRCARPPGGGQGALSGARVDAGVPGPVPAGIAGGRRGGRAAHRAGVRGGRRRGLLYIATRFVAGGDLLRLQRAAGGPLPPAQAADLVSQVASALDAAHAIGLVHRDVKPANILVESIPGRPEHAYLSDFGLSKSTTAGTTGLTATGRFMGTPDYCAPEQITGGARRRARRPVLPGLRRVQPPRRRRAVQPRRHAVETLRARQLPGSGTDLHPAGVAGRRQRGPGEGHGEEPRRAL